MEKDLQPTDPQRQTEETKKPRKPWPMKWIVLFILIYLSVYTYLRLK